MATKTSSFAKPKNADASNAFDGFVGSGGGGFTSPYELGYRGSAHKIGEAWVIRILSLHPDYIIQQPARRVTIKNPKDGSLMQGVIVADPGAPLNEELTDHAGKRLCDCKAAEIHRVPVWVYGHYTDKGQYEEVDEFKYIEFGTALRISLQQLEEQNRGLCKFDKETGRPEYDILLKIVTNQQNKKIPKTYEFEAITQDSESLGKDPNFGVPAETVLEAVKKQIEELWDTVQDEMRKGLSDDDVRKRLAEPEDGDGKPEDLSSEEKTQAPSRRPGFGAARKTAPAAVTEEDEEDDPPTQAPPAKSTTRRPSFKRN